MKAAFIERYGGPEVFQYGEFADPVAGSGEVVVDLRPPVERSRRPLECIVELYRAGAVRPSRDQALSVGRGCRGPSTQRVPPFPGQAHLSRPLNG
jgi:hypothetical protein